MPRYSGMDSVHFGGIMLRFPAIFLMLFAAACVERGQLSLTDKSAVQTPVYTANKALFLTPDTDDNGKIVNARNGLLLNAYEIAEQMRDGKQPQGTRRSIKNRQPLSIVVSRAYVPATLKECNGRVSDFLAGNEGRDIALLLDVSTGSSGESFIAVWYQTGVPPGTMLNFGDLLVYSSDAWDSKYPPYFRFRLVDVTAERNTAVGAMLDRLGSASGTLAGLADLTSAGPLINLAGLAARSILAHEKNKAIVDFTFQLYGDQALGEAGGVPLGVLQTGGLIITAPPCGQSVDYWERSLHFDHRRDRIVENRAIQEMPYVFATILGADLSVPQIVRDRSNAIMERLTDPEVAQRDIDAAQADATRLADTLGSLKEWEYFRRQPTKSSFDTIVTHAQANFSKFDGMLRSWFLNGFYQVTGVSLSTADEYDAWLTRCGGVATFDQETGRFVVDKAVKDANGADCW